MVWSILTTLFCCWPVGIAAIVNSTRVNKYWETGNTAAAQDASRKAKRWIIITAILGIVGGIIGFASGVLQEL